MTARKLTAALIGGFLLAASFTPIASAGGNGAVSEGDNPADFLYWENGFLVMTGAADEFCVEEDPPTLPGQVVAPSDGSLMLHTRGIVHATVYEIPDIDPLDIDLVVEWLLANCEAEPYASGEASVRSLFRFDTAGVLHIRNGLNGTLTTPGGDSVRVHTFARVDINAGTGALIELYQLEADVH
jgi:hypothetical protein